MLYTVAGNLVRKYPYNISYPGTFCLRFFLCDRKARRLRLWMAAINRRTSVIVKVFKGMTPTSRPLRWDTVIAGAFFPQAYVHMPEESVSRQCCGLTHQYGQ